MVGLAFFFGVEHPVSGFALAHDRDETPQRVDLPVESRLLGLLAGPGDPFGIQALHIVAGERPQELQVQVVRYVPGVYVFV